MNTVVLYLFLAFTVWLVRRDIKRRTGISSALWIPTIWVALDLSRPASFWLGWGGGTDAMEGSPLDALLAGVLILISFAVLRRRQMSWNNVIRENWPVFLFYAYLLISVLWAESAFVSFKRWFKEFGNIAVLLVILTEVNPLQAFRAVFVRCTYLMLPLSIIFIRWFPNLGRVYSRHTGEMEAVGVTFQKNSLGMTVLVCSLILIWDWIEWTQPGMLRQKKFDRYLPFAFFAMGAYLLYLCNSKTSLTCLVLGGSIILSVRLPLVRQRVGVLGGYILGGTVTFFLLDQIFGITESVVHSMGRDMTLTGRTEVWREILNLKTPPIFGTGFLSFWSDNFYQSRLPDWVVSSAHNGYLEMYIDGGIVGLSLLVLMLCALALKLNRRLATHGNYALVRFAILLVVIISNFSESNFGRMSAVGFLFLLAAIDIPHVRRPSLKAIAGAQSNRPASLTVRGSEFAGARQTFSAREAAI